MNDNLYAHGFFRVGAYAPEVALGRPDENAKTVIEVVEKASDDGVGLAVFPQLFLTGVSLGDHFASAAIVDATNRALKQIVEAATDLLPVIVVGAPLLFNKKMYNCSVVIHRGRVVKIVPKRALDIEESRWFTAGSDVEAPVEFLGQPVTFGTMSTIQLSGGANLKIHVDLNGSQPDVYPAALISSGASILVWPGCDSAVAGSAARKRKLLAAESERLHATIVSVDPGVGESTSEATWAGNCVIAENGHVLAAARGAQPNGVVADVDLDLLAGVRRKLRKVGVENVDLGSSEEQFSAPSGDLGLRREVPRYPFFPSTPDSYAEIFELQASALQRRLAAVGDAKIVLGVSGGLDSTHALLISAEAMDRAGRPRTDILTFTMPGFATTSHTKSNAQDLAEAIGASFETIDIRETAELMLKNIGHPLDVYDVTYENVQAGLRTDYLFRIANQRGGIVLGTGDMSELALGWCTYGVGDQMSHYAVNSGLPKTLMQQLVRWAIESNRFGADVAGVLQSILDTEITPELIPTTEGAKPQATESSIGPYNLHDFFLYWHLLGMCPSKIAYLARHAWSDASRGEWPYGFPEASKVEYSAEDVERWLKVFLSRFTTQQFKRTASPSGPALLPGGSLSPRGGWVAPSDANPKTLLGQLEE